jgi:hypothetical protein
MYYKRLKDYLKDTLVYVEWAKTLRDFINQVRAVNSRLDERRWDKKEVWAPDFSRKQRRGELPWFTVNTSYLGSGPMEIDAVQKKKLWKKDKKWSLNSSNQKGGTYSKKPQKIFKYFKCGKLSHYARNCRNSKQKQKLFGVLSKEPERGSTKSKARAIGMLRKEKLPSLHTIDEYTFRAGKCLYHPNTEMVILYRHL